MDRGLGGDALISLASHTNLPVDMAITKSRPPSFTTAPSSTLLFGPNSIAASFSILSECEGTVSSNASDRSLASSACACSSSSIGLGRR
jgi:hypothetical protein